MKGFCCPCMVTNWTALIKQCIHYTRCGMVYVKVYEFICIQMLYICTHIYVWLCILECASFIYTVLHHVNTHSHTHTQSLNFKWFNIYLLFSLCPLQAKYLHSFREIFKFTYSYFIWQMPYNDNSLKNI